MTNTPLGYLGVKLSKTKNKKGLLWYVLGIVVGPAAIAIINKL